MWLFKKCLAKEQGSFSTNSEGGSFGGVKVPLALPQHHTLTHTLTHTPTTLSILPPSLTLTLTHTLTLSQAGDQGAPPSPPHGYGVGRSGAGFGSGGSRGGWAEGVGRLSGGRRAGDEEEGPQDVVPYGSWLAAMPSLKVAPGMTPVILPLQVGVVVLQVG